MLEINYWGVVGAAVAAIVIGSLWYGPLFGKLWMEGMGWDPNDASLREKGKKMMWRLYLGQIIASLLTAGVLAHVMAAFALAMPGQNAFSFGIQAGFWMWLGFALPLQYGASLWTGKKFVYTLVDIGNSLVTFMVMGVILAL